MLGGVFLWLLRRRESACRRCPHDRDSHKPYDPRVGKPGYCAARAGAATCGCWQYKPEHFWTLALAWMSERPPPITADVLRQHPVRFPVPDWCEDDDDWNWDDDRTRIRFRAAPYAPRPKWGP